MNDETKKQRTTTRRVPVARYAEFVANVDELLTRLADRDAAEQFDRALADVPSGTALRDAIVRARFRTVANGGVR